MKTITYNPETHVLVPREPGLDITEPGWEAVAWKDISSPSQLYLVWKARLAAAPQPEPVDVDPAGYVDYGDRVEWYKKPAPETDLYTTPQPDRVTELEAALKIASSAITRLIEVTPSSLGQCSGLKCREPYCISCYEEADAEVYLQSVYDLCHEAQGVVTCINEVIGER